MGDGTGIEWTDATWNPFVGCTAVSPGCDHCYAARQSSGRLKNTPAYKGLAEGGIFNGTVRLLPDRLDQPLKWTRPRRIFVNSMSDLFHEGVPDDYVAKVFAVMSIAKQHTFQVLTKRHGRMRSLLHSDAFRTQMSIELARRDANSNDWPLRNVWMGVSVEDQKWADVRIPALLGTPAAVRFLSCEPLLGSLDLSRWLHGGFGRAGDFGDLGWVIVGGESGPGARPMHPDWVRGLRDECVAAGVAFHFKQYGEWSPVRPPDFGGRSKADRSRRLTHLLPDGSVYDGKSNEQWQAGTSLYRVGKHDAGRELDGRTWDEWPQVDVREAVRS